VRAALIAPLRARLQVCGQTADGSLVKIKTARGWALTIAAR
jgi:hypothetical protein